MYTRGHFKLERTEKVAPLRDTDTIVATVQGRNRGETVEILSAGNLLAVNDIGPERQRSTAST
jgi:hypothetical protein